MHAPPTDKISKDVDRSLRVGGRLSRQHVDHSLLQPRRQVGEPNAPEQRDDHAVDKEEGTVLRFRIDVLELENCTLVVEGDLKQIRAAEKFSRCSSQWPGSARAAETASEVKEPPSNRAQPPQWEMAPDADRERSEDQQRQHLPRGWHRQRRSWRGT